MSKNNEENQFPQKYMKKIGDLPGFMDGVNAADTNELKTKIVLFENHIYELENEKENNETLKNLKEELKMITKPFSEAKGIETAKIKYCLYVLESRGIKV